MNNIIIEKLKNVFEDYIIHFIEMSININILF